MNSLHSKQPKGTDSDRTNAEVIAINIMGLSYSGGTWLGFLLGSNNNAFMLGELHLAARRQETPCLIHGDECPVWPHIDISPDATVNPLIQIANRTEKKFLIFSHNRRPKLYQDHPNITSVILYLHRDPRALAASNLRKGITRSTLHSIRYLLHEERRLRKIIRRSKNRNIIHVSYEQLTSDTAGTLKRISNAIGMTYHADQLEYWNFDHCCVFGNPTTVLEQAKKKQSNTDTISNHAAKENWQHDKNQNYDPASFTDQRWKSELKRWQQHLIAATVNPIVKLMHKTV